MDVESIFQEVQNELSPKRWRHTQGVMNKAIELAQRHEGNVEQARLAALLHDAVREWTPDQWLTEAKLVGLVIDEAVRHSPVLLHAPLAASTVILGRDTWAALPRPRSHNLSSVGFQTRGRVSDAPARASIRAR